MTQSGWLGSDFTICTEFLICRLNYVRVCVGRCIATRSVNLLTISSTLRFALIFINGPNIHHCWQFNWTFSDLWCFSKIKYCTNLVFPEGCLFSHIFRHQQLLLSICLCFFSTAWLCFYHKRYLDNLLINRAIFSIVNTCNHKMNN